MKKWLDLLRSEHLLELARYGVIGVLTTLVNLAVYYVFMLPFGGAPSNGAITAGQVVAWVASVAFAFVANRAFVFRSRARGAREIGREALSFTAARLLSLLFDLVFVLAMVNFAQMDDMIAKIISNVIVVVLNYFASKLWIFKPGSN